MKNLTNDPDMSAAAAVAREMAKRGVPRAVFMAAVDDAAGEMVRAVTRKGVVLAAAYRAVREYRTTALEEFDRLSSYPITPAS